MRVYSTLLPLAGAIGAFLFVAPTAATPGVSASPASEEAFRVREVRRIRAHFDSVLVELAKRDVSPLTRAQLDRRAAIITTLSAYRDRGAFPHNYDFPGRAIPYFVDRQTGVLCAVAHLLESTGRRDIVDRVARANNNVWVPELAGDRAFTTWLDRSGLTLAEAARIQVPYTAEPSASGVSAVLVGGGGSLVMSVWNATANRHGNGRVGTFLGVTLGLTAMAAGPVTMASSDDARGVGAVTWASGAASTP